MEQTIVKKQPKEVISYEEAIKLLGKRWEHIDKKTVESIITELSTLAHQYVEDYLNCNDNITMEKT
jgi:hypothetical protein